MNCTEVRASLAEFIYGDLASDLKLAAEKHLSDCPDCRGKRDALLVVRRSLDLVPIATSQLDMSGLYECIARRHEGLGRRWRRVAMTASALAATLLIALGAMFFDFRVRDGRISLGWRSAQADRPLILQPETVVSSFSKEEQDRLAALDQRLHLASELIHALAENLQEVDHRQRDDTARLEARLAALQQVYGQRWSDIVRVVTALQPQSEKGGFHGEFK
jgi:hypothetical protein